MGTILLVCTGNICRSPMAEGLLRQRLADRRLDVQVESAGVAGWEDSPPTPEAVEALAEVGIDISAHVARRLRRSMIEQADLVIAMAGEHREAVARLEPAAEGRTFTLKELVRLLGGEGPTRANGDLRATLRGAVARASAARGAAGDTGPLDEDVPDPLGLGIEAFRASAWELDQLVAAAVDEVFGTASAGGS